MALTKYSHLTNAELIRLVWDIDDPLISELISRIDPAGARGFKFTGRDMENEKAAENLKKLVPQ